MTAIEENDLFNIGWVRLGDDEDDPFYRFHSNVPVLGELSLSGDYKPDGSFEIYGVPKVFNSADGIAQWLSVVGFVEDKELTERMRKPAVGLK